MLAQIRMKSETISNSIGCTRATKKYIEYNISMHSKKERECFTRLVTGVKFFRNRPDTSLAEYYYRICRCFIKDIKQ